MKKIIFIDHEPFTLKRAESFSVFELRERGHVVEIWDMSRFFHPNMFFINEIGDTSKCSINNLDDLIAKIRLVDIYNSIFIIEVPFIWRNRFFYKIIQQKQCSYFIIDVNANVFLPNVSKISKLRLMSFRALFSCIYNIFFRLLFLVYKRIYKITPIFISSRNSPSVKYLINHPDWINIQSSDSSVRIMNERYILFIDQYFPSHPDLKFYINEKNDIDEKNYLISLNSFFAKLELKYKMKIVIAAHPKSQYSSSEFEGRTVLKGKTMELTRDAEFVLLHSSNSLSYIIVFDKKFSFIVTNDFLKVFVLKYHLNNLCQFTKIPYYNIEEDNFDDYSPSTVSADLREKYIYGTLTSRGIEKLSNGEILSCIFENVNII